MTDNPRRKLHELLALYHKQLSLQMQQALATIMLSPGLTEKEIAVQLDLKGTRANAILKKLEAKGLIRSDDGTPLRYAPQNPKTIFDILDRERVERDALMATLEPTLMQVYEAKVLSNQPPVPENTVQILGQTSDALTWMSDRSRRAMSSIRIVGGDLTFLRNNPRLKSELLAKKDSCTIRILTYTSAHSGDSLVVELNSLGIPVRRSEVHQLPIVVIDEKHVLIAFAQYREDGAPWEIYKCVHASSAGLGKTLAATFDSAWEKGEPL